MAEFMGTRFTADITISIHLLKFVVVIFVGFETWPGANCAAVRGLMVLYFLVHLPVIPWENIKTICYIMWYWKQPI